MERHDFERRSAQQYGVFSRSQLVGLGASAKVIERGLSSGRWEVVFPGVYGLVGHRPSWRRMLWAAHLHAGPRSVVSHEAAARLHGFEQVPAGRIVLAVPVVGSREPAGVRWHRIDDLVPSDVITRSGLPPLTSAARTAVDVASVLHVASLRLLVEQGVIERRFELSQVGAVLGRVRRRGKPGVRKLSVVLDDLGPGDGIPRSELERLLDEMIDRAGLPAPVHEHVLPNARGRTGFVDRCWPEARLIAEADGRRWHARRQQMRADADRTLESQALGYETTRLLWEHLRHDRAATATLFRSVYDHRRALIVASG
jgi:hypothetical protein